MRTPADPPRRPAPTAKKRSPRNAVARQPADTSPEAVAAMLARAMHAKQARYGYASPAVLPRVPVRTAAPAKTVPRKAVPPVEGVSRSLPSWPDRIDAHVASLAPYVHRANAVWGACVAFLWPSPPAAVPQRSENAAAAYERALAREVGSGRRIILVAGLITLGWAGFVPLSGAVIVPGSLVLQSSVKKVQHPAGGVVASILVHNGSRVRVGDELARLEETSVRSNLQVLARQLDEAKLRIARLHAERDGATEPKWPELSARVDEAERRRLLASEAGLFTSRAQSRRDQEQIAANRIEQLERQVTGLDAQLNSNTRQLSIATRELQGVEKLLREKLLTMDRLNTIQREVARLEGAGGQLESQIAETRTKIGETRIQAAQTEQAFKSEVLRDLRDAEEKEGELAERKLAADEQVHRTVIRAPASGTIQELALHTVGGVVSPGEVMMAVVPEGDQLEIEARLSPDKIDQVHVGQPAHVRLSAFNARMTPQLDGVVAVISGDVIHEAQGAPHYDVRLSLPSDQVKRLGPLKLVAGMPAEVFFETDRRTLLSYLFKPLSDQFSRMFRER